MFCSWCFITLASTLRHDPFWVNFYTRRKAKAKAHCFARGYAVILAPSVEILSLLNCLGTCVKNQLTVFVLIYFGALKSVPLICMSILMPIPHYLDYYSFIQHVLESSSPSPPTLFFISKNYNVQGGTSCIQYFHPVHFN